MNALIKCPESTTPFEIREIVFNPLQPGAAYLYPLKTPENLKVF